MLCRGCSGILVVLVAAILGLGLGVLDCVVSGTITKPLKSINNNKQEPVSAAADRPLESSLELVGCQQTGLRQNGGNHQQPTTCFVLQTRISLIFFPCRFLDYSTVDSCDLKRCRPPGRDPAPCPPTVWRLGPARRRPRP